MNYLEFYGLEQEPFSNAPVSRFYFQSQQHTEALLRLRRVVEQMKGLAVLSGGIGTGKTTLARRLLDSLPEEEFEAALLVIIHSGITAQWLLRRIAQQLGVVKPAEEKLQILSQLYRRLLQIADGGRKAVVLIDEAQMFKTREIMEEFRGLLNLEIPERKLLTFVFFGLPEIEENLKLDPPLLQRVALKWALDALDPASVPRYVEHRLRLAGAANPIFEPDAVEAIASFTEGVPRLINTVADNALFEGFILKVPRVPRSVVENIAADLGLKPGRKRDLRVVSAFEVPAPAGVASGLAEEAAGREEKTSPDAARTHEQPPPSPPSSENPFERDGSEGTEDIDAILAGLEEKL